MVEEFDGFRSGFISVVGRPNTGKSTLVNTLVKRKVAIVSDKPQTTRFPVRAVVNLDKAQMIMIDNPGFHKPRHEMGERLNREVLRSLNECDGVLFMMDAASGIGSGDAFLAGVLGKVTSPLLMVLNKEDLCAKDVLAEERRKAGALGPWPLLEISALNGSGLDELLVALTAMLPPGPMYYPEGMLSDQPEERIVSEVIREKILELTYEEVPHSIAVVVEEMVPRKEREFLDIEAVIYVENESQKGIIVGKKGAMLKEIGTRSRRELEALLGSRMFLGIRVKRKKNWRKDPSFLARLGIR